MGRKPCCDKVGLKKGPWTAEEDKKLVDFILNNGHCCWRAVPKLAGLLRCGKSCRLRWTNYLRPDLKRGELSDMEEQLIMDLHSKLGNRWAKIAAYLPGRTDNEIKNYWNTHIKKKLRRMGIDPLTHQPIADSPSSAPPIKLPMSAENSEAEGIAELKPVDEAVQSFKPGQIRLKEEAMLSASTKPDEQIIDSFCQSIPSDFGVHDASMFAEDVRSSHPGSSSNGREKTLNEYLEPEVRAENTLLFHPQEGVPLVLQSDDNLMWELGDFVGCFAKRNPTCFESMESCNAALFNMDLMAAGSILAPAEMTGHPWEHGMDPFLGWEAADPRPDQAFCTELRGLAATLDSL